MTKAVEIDRVGAVLEVGQLGLIKNGAVRVLKLDQISVDKHSRERPSEHGSVTDRENLDELTVYVLIG